MTRRWPFWLVVACVVAYGVSTVGNTTADSSPGSGDTSLSDGKALLLVTDQKDGDSWVASDGTEYRLGLIDTPERNEPCGPEATAFTREFLGDGFAADAYATDTYGRSVAEVRDPDGTSLNVELARTGLAGGRYLEKFRHQNPDLARRLDRALAAAERPACHKAGGPAR